MTTTDQVQGEKGAAAAGLSIVVPVYNEGAGLAQFHERLVAVARRLRQQRGLATEVIYVDDGSQDDTFAVARDANKLQIKHAVESEFKVDVLGVRVLTVKPKQKRRGRRQMGTVPGWRKAVVTIADGQKIELFETV